MELRQKVERTVAIIGMWRSGTTWISKVVDSAPDVFYLHEPDYVVRVDCVPLVADVQDAAVWSRYLQDYVAGFRGYCSARSVMKRPMFPKKYLEGLSSRLGFALFTGRLEIDQVLSWVTGSSPKRSWPNSVERAKVVAWKSVELTGSLGVLLRALPDQKVVHVIRHPCGFVDSVIRGEKKGLLETKVPVTEDAGLFDFATRTGVARKLGIRTFDWPALSRVERMAYFWLCVNEQAAEDAEGMSNYMRLYFDEFCMKPVELSKQMFEFLGLPFTQQTGAFLSTSSAVPKGSSYFSVSRQSEQVPGSWAGRLDADEANSIMKIATSMPRMAALLEGGV